jgi:hypothetical protein
LREITETFRHPINQTPGEENSAILEADLEAAWTAPAGDHGWSKRFPTGPAATSQDREKCFAGQEKSPAAHGCGRGDFPFRRPSLDGQACNYSTLTGFGFNS